jgi:hypothetical protein
MQANNWVSTNMESIVTVTITLNSEFLINNENRLASDE